MITNMVAKKDYLLTFSHVLFGQVFFIPSLELLDEIAGGDFPSNEAD
jgi:dyp family peroxidase family protein